MNRYKGNSGRYSRYTEVSRNVPQQPIVKPENKVQCVKRNEVKRRDMSDMWILAVFFMLYLESRDTDFLIILAVLAFYAFDFKELLKIL